MTFACMHDSMSGVSCPAWVEFDMRGMHAQYETWSGPLSLLSDQSYSEARGGADGRGKAAHALHAAGQSRRNSMKALLCLLVLSAADALAAAAEATVA